MPKDSNLHKAAYKGDVGTVEDLLEQGEDVNSRGAQLTNTINININLVFVH